MLQGLKAKPQYNGKLVRLGSHRADGRIETERPGSGQEMAARPENLRGLLDVYDGRAAGDKMEFDDGEIELLGIDPKEAHWACKKGSWYLWIPEYNF